MCRTACDEVSAVPTVLTVTNLCQTKGAKLGEAAVGVKRAAGLVRMPGRGHW